MAVAYDAYSAQSTTATTMSWTHTPSGTPRGVLVFITWNSSGGSIGGVTYGGVAMTALSPAVTHTESGSTHKAIAFFLGTGIPTGSQTVLVNSTYSGTKVAVAITVTASQDTEIADEWLYAGTYYKGTTLTPAGGVFGVANAHVSVGTQYVTTGTQLYEASIGTYSANFARDSSGQITWNAGGALIVAAIDELEQPLTQTESAVAVATAGGIPSAGYSNTEGFESDFGIWEDGGGDRTWTRLSGATGSSNTGPSSAYAGSYYAYCETSSPVVEGDTFILQTSSWLDGKAGGSVDFQRHMYGATMGTLLVQYAVESAPSTWNTVDTTSGDQGNSWIADSATIPATGERVKIRFHYTRGGSYTGDAALDAVSLSLTAVTTYAIGVGLAPSAAVAEAVLGTPTLDLGQPLSTASVIAEANVGQPSISIPINPQAAAATSVVGTPTVRVELTAAGASAQTSLGTPSLVVGLSPPSLIVEQIQSQGFDDAEQFEGETSGIWADGGGTGATWELGTAGSVTRNCMRTDIADTGSDYAYLVTTEWMDGKRGGAIDYIFVLYGLDTPGTFAGVLSVQYAVESAPSTWNTLGNHVGNHGPSWQGGWWQDIPATGERVKIRFRYTSGTAGLPQSCAVDALVIDLEAGPVGEPDLAVQVSPQNAVSDVALGTPSLAAIGLSPSSAVAVAVLGSPSIDIPQPLSPTSVAAVAALGTAAIAVLLEPPSVLAKTSGLTPTLAVSLSPQSADLVPVAGTPEIAAALTASSAESRVAIGSPNTAVALSPESAESASAPGTPSLEVPLGPQSLEILSAVGTPSISLEVPLSPGSAEATGDVGTPTVQVLLTPESAEAEAILGTPSAGVGLGTTSAESVIQLGAAGIATALTAVSAIAVVDTGAASVSLRLSPDAALTGVAVATPTISESLKPDSVVVVGRLGTPELSVPVALSPQSARANCELGTPSISLEVHAPSAAAEVLVGVPVVGVLLQPSGASAEGLVGTPEIGASLSPESAEAEAILGTPSISMAVPLSPESAEAVGEVGTPVVQILLSPEGIPSSAVVGAPALTVPLSPESGFEATALVHPWHTTARR